jgi:hypothetical protein
MSQGNGHGEKLSRKQEQAIAALLTRPTLERAAAACNLTGRTLSRWLRDPGFARAYRDARRQIVEQAVTQLQGLCRQAVEVLHANMLCGDPGVEVRAALGVLDRAIKGVELADLAERVEQLEALAAEERERDKRQ